MFCVHWILLSLLSVKYTCLVYNPGLLASLITWKVLKLWEYSPHKNSLSKFNFKIKLLKINVQTLNVFRSLERIAMRDEIKDGIWTKGDGETKDEDCKKESLSSKAVGVILSRYNQFFLTSKIMSKKRAKYECTHIRMLMCSDFCTLFEQRCDYSFDKKNPL